MRPDYFLVRIKIAVLGHFFECRIAMQNPIYEKNGFRLRVAKGDSKAAIELLQTGRLCSLYRFEDVSLILLGEVLDEGGFLAGSEILKRFCLFGVQSVREFDGSFVLVFLSGRGNAPIVITDPLNAKKCFVEETPEAFILVSSLCFLPDRSRSLDRVAMTSFLVNGVIHNNRTPFDGVRSLARAHIHTVSTEGITSQPYWQHQFDDRYAGMKRQEIREKLAALLFAAAERRTKSSERIYLSLSGGYDSTCILGLLSRLRPGPVECFSYRTGEARRAGSDESVAAQMAEVAGFPHWSVDSFAGDLTGLIRRNAWEGEGRANFCGELDAWQKMRGEMGDDGVLFVGDHCFGWEDCRLGSIRDVLASLKILSSDVLLSYRDCIDVAKLGEDYDREILEFAEAARNRDLHKTKDSLYLDQRLGSVILPWRELASGGRIPCRNLLLDRRILDFVAHLPSSLRRGKKLYKETVRMMFPELFRMERAFVPAVDLWAEAVKAQWGQIQEESMGGRSLFDEWLTLPKCSSLAQRSVRQKRVSFKKKMVNFGKKSLKAIRWAPAIKGFFPSQARKSVDPATLFVRIATLRQYLKVD